MSADTVRYLKNVIVGLEAKVKRLEQVSSDEETDQERYYRNRNKYLDNKVARMEKVLVTAEDRHTKNVQTALAIASANPTTLEVIRRWVGWGLLIAITLIVFAQIALGQETESSFHIARFEHDPVMVASVEMWKSSSCSSYGRDCYRAKVRHNYRIQNELVSAKGRQMEPMAMFIGPEPSGTILGYYMNEFYWHCPEVSLVFKDRDGFVVGTKSDGGRTEIDGGTVVWFTGARISRNRPFAKIVASIDGCVSRPNPYAARIP